MIKFLANLIKFLANLFHGPSYIVSVTPSPGQDYRRLVLGRAKTATQDNAPPEPAWDLDCLVRAFLNATSVHGEQPGRFSFPFSGLNAEEVRTIATIASRSNGFRSLTADDLRTLQAIIRMQQFRQDDPSS